ncbi:MAG: glycosyltransferase family 39 protein [Chloracidobacterium sp.]|nr:glycosyltransferase family 39 protein [Chloracidobacterium sp.]
MPDRTARAGTGAFLLILLHLLIALPLAFSLNIWAEEASTLFSTQHGLLSAIRHAAIDERQPPLYFWVMSLWRSIDGSIFFARLFSIICSIVAIRVFAGTARRVFTREATLLATAFFALHPVLVWASTEIRSYSLVVLLSVISVRLFLDIFLESNGRRNARWLWLAFTAVVAAYTSYHLLYLFAGFLAAFFIAGKWEQAKRYLLVHGSRGHCVHSSDIHREDEGRRRQFPIGRLSDRRRTGPLARAVNIHSARRAVFVGCDHDGLGRTCMDSRGLLRRGHSWRSSLLGFDLSPNGRPWLRHGRLGGHITSDALRPWAV